MTVKEFFEAIAQGKTLLMAKYKGYGQYSAFKAVSHEVALHKANVRVRGGFCPYTFKVAK